MEARSERRAWIPEPVFAEIGRIYMTFLELISLDLLSASEKSWPLNSCTGNPLSSSKETILLSIVTFLLISKMSVLFSKRISF